MFPRRLSFVLQASSSHSSSSSTVSMGRRNSLPLMMASLPNNHCSDGQLSRNFSTNPRWTNKDESTTGGAPHHIVESISSTVTMTEKRIHRRRLSDSTRRRSSMVEDEEDEEQYDDHFNKSGFYVDSSMRRERDSSFLLDRLRRQQVETSVFDKYSSHLMDEWKGYAEEPDETKSQNRCDL